MANVRPAPDAVTPQSEVDSPAGDAATLETILLADSPMLIGISGGPEDRTAIMISTKGDILRAKSGETTESGTVLAIGEDQVQLQTEEGLVLALALPE
ncbi:hypothetical protein P1J78_05390 [Psychromarinibacter sp. C21-152]|uniref:Type IV pilus biogenesis n=1 Tax=Psychromarinibacter sediminicola TaxID=3033385 RepID=A0AAE3T7X2_9RHOB|nr:hypothetical protein [Psychromarinibacter sediminicola]MDF0600158.1 hypothetical protein [Psychromarinibacter sediminicola]